MVAAASVVAQVATYPNLAPWYPGLVKPSFNPPNWVFGPVWTTLYLMMAFAVWRILRLPEASAERRWALGLFIAQLALNAAWSWMFFAADKPLLGLINIVPQILVILATIVAFYRLDRMAGWCLVPLAAWVSFATVLNFAIWKNKALLPCGGPSPSGGPVVLADCPAALNIVLAGRAHRQCCGDGYPGATPTKTRMREVPYYIEFLGPCDVIRGGHRFSEMIMLNEKARAKL